MSSIFAKNWGSLFSIKKCLYHSITLNSGYQLQWQRYSKKPVWRKNNSTNDFGLLQYSLVWFHSFPISPGICIVHHKSISVCVYVHVIKLWGFDKDHTYLVCTLGLVRTLLVCKQFGIDQVCSTTQKSWPAN